MRVRSFQAFLLIIWVFLFLFSQSSADVTLDFDLPIVPDQSRGPVPISDLKAEVSFNEFYKTTSDNYILLLVNTPWKGIWSAVRLAHDGTLIDTIPRQIRSSTDTFTLGTYGLTWFSPYFYLWEGGDGFVYFTRFTEDLTLVDTSPRQLASIPKMLTWGGQEAWTMDEMRHVWGYDAILESTIVDGVQITGWPQMTGVFIKGIVNNGLYVTRRNTIDYVTDLAHISREGKVTVLAPAPYNSLMYEGNRYSDDSVLFWIVGDNISPSTLKYFFASPLDSLASQAFHEIDLSEYLYSSSHESFTTIGQTGILTGTTSNNDYQWFAMNFDLSGDSILSFRYFGPRSIASTSNTAISQVGDSVSIFYRKYDGIEMATLSGKDLSTISDPHPVLYGLGYHSRPSMVKDSLGLLIYFTEGTDQGSSIAGYRWNYPIIENLAYPLRTSPLIADSAIVSPHLFEVDERKGLFWKERLPDELSGCQSRFFQQKVVLFHGEAPTSTELAEAQILDTTRLDPYLPPSTVRIRDTLYIVSYMTGHLRSIDLLNNKKTELEITNYTSTAPLLLNRADTLINTGMRESCGSSCGNIGCCSWVRYLYIREYVDDANVANFQGNIIGDEKSLLSFKPILRSIYIDGKFYVAVADPPSVQLIDFDSRSSATVVDLSSMLTTPLNDHFSKPMAFIVPYSNYRIVLYFRHDTNLQEAFVFDQDWRLLSQQPIPVLGEVQEVAGVEFAADSTTMILAYTSFLPYPYSTERLVMQTFALDISTGINDPSAVPDRFNVFQNYPNPFNPVTTVAYNLPKRVHVTIEIFNILGQRVKTLVDREESAGKHSVIWNGNDNHGSQLATGIYLYRMQAGDYFETKKMVLIK